MTKAVRIAFLSLALFAAARCFAADMEAPGRPVQALAERYYAAYAASDWGGMANTLDAKEISDFVGLFREVLKPLGIVSDGANDSVARGEIYEWYFDSKPEAKEYVASRKAHVLGLVPEGGNLTHIVVRVDATALGDTFSDVELLTASRTGQERRLKLPEKIQVLKRAFERGRSESNQSAQPTQ